ncbi:MAG: helix-turn-helix domain-containing protein [Polyangiaceae bacterium]
MDLGELGTRIRKRREARALRQADLASALRVTPQAVSKWERGENAPDITVLVPLSRLLDVSVEWLLGGSANERETIDAVVMVTVVAGYAERSRAEPPRALAAWINGIHHTATEAVRHFDGVPVKYVGDGALAFFSGPGLVERAVGSALRVRGLVEGLTVALHRGPIYLGRIGHEDYAAPDILGAAVNVAFMALPHVTERCATRVGITASLAGDLPPGVEAKTVGSAELAGERAPIELLELHGSARAHGETHG